MHKSCPHTKSLRINLPNENRKIIITTIATTKKRKKRIKEKKGKAWTIDQPTSRPADRPTKRTNVQTNKQTELMSKNHQVFNHCENWH